MATGPRAHLALELVHVLAFVVIQTLKLLRVLGGLVATRPQHHAAFVTLEAGAMEELAVNDLSLDEVDVFAAHLAFVTH